MLNVRAELRLSRVPPCSAFTRGHPAHRRQARTPACRLPVKLGVLVHACHRQQAGLARRPATHRRRPACTKVEYTCRGQAQELDASFCYYYVKPVLNVRYNYRHHSARRYTFIMGQVDIHNVCVCYVRQRHLRSKFSA